MYHRARFVFELVFRYTGLFVGKPKCIESAFDQRIYIKVFMQIHTYIWYLTRTMFYNWHSDMCRIAGPYWLLYSTVHKQHVVYNSLFLQLRSGPWQFENERPFDRSKIVFTAIIRSATDRSQKRNKKTLCRSRYNKTNGKASGKQQPRHEYRETEYLPTRRNTGLRFSNYFSGYVITVVVCSISQYASR